MNKTSAKQNIAIIKRFAITDFKLRYNGSVLGYLWALLKPLLIFTILNFVFSNIFGQKDPNYSLKLLTSLVMWNFFAEGTMTGMVSIVSKAGILTKIYLPKWAVVIASTLHILFTYILNLFIVLIFFIFYGFLPSFADIFALIIYSSWIYILILAFSFVFSPLFVKFRDLNQIWEVLLTAGFYATPIIYPLSAIPEYLHWVLQINPMTFIIQHVQAALFLPEFSNLLLPNLIYFSILIIGLITSIVWFKAQSKRLLEVI